MAESTVVACPNCGKRYKISADKLGRTFKCTGCETRFQAGAEPEPTPPPVMEEPVQENSMFQTQTSYEETTPAQSDFDSAGADSVSAHPATVDSATAAYGSTGTGPVKTSGMAIASLIFGLLGCVPGAQLLAVLFGFLGLKKINKGLATGKGLAITGLVLGLLGIVCYIGAIVFVVPVVMKGRQAALAFVVDVQMQQIYSGISQYQTKNEQHYPPNLAEVWKADPALNGAIFVSPLSKDTPATDPSQLDVGGHDSYTYIYPGADVTSVDPADVLVYEKWTDMNGKNVSVMFGDGKIKTCKPTEAMQFISATGKHPHPASGPSTP
jgi:predicted Zn finger-like uncharacterized protein